MPPQKNHGDGPVKTLLQKQFVINALPQRVWDLLGRTVYGCLPLEQVQIMNERTASGLLRWRFAFFNFPLNLKIELIDISPSKLLGTKIWVKAGVFQIAMVITFVLSPAKGNKTELICTAMSNEKGTIYKWILERRQRVFTENIFNSIGARFKQLLDSP